MRAFWFLASEVKPSGRRAPPAFPLRDQFQATERREESLARHGKHQTYGLAAHHLQEEGQPRSEAF